MRLPCVNPLSQSKRISVPERPLPRSKAHGVIEARGGCSDWGRLVWRLPAVRTDVCDGPAAAAPVRVRCNDARRGGAAFPAG
jgi:hypothetical protein